VLVILGHMLIALGPDGQLQAGIARSTRDLGPDSQSQTGVA